MRALMLLLVFLVPCAAQAQELRPVIREDNRPRVLVLEVEPGQGVTKDTAQITTSLLLGKLRQIPEILIVALRDVEGAMTAEQRRMLAGCDEVSCAAEIAGALNADQLVMGRLGRLGTQYVLYLSRFEQRTALPVSQSTLQFPATGDEAIAAQIPEAVRQLFPDAFAPPPPAAAPAPSTPSAAAPTIIIQQPAATTEKARPASTLSTVMRGVGSVLGGAGVLLFFAGAVAMATGAAIFGLYVWAFYIARQTQLAIALVPVVPLGTVVGIVGVVLGVLGVGATGFGVLMLVGGGVVE